MEITQKQFDNLQLGNELISITNATKLICQGKIGEVLIVKVIYKPEKSISSCTYCIEELIYGGYEVLLSDNA